MALLPLWAHSPWAAAGLSLLCFAHKQLDPGPGVLGLDQIILMRIVGIVLRFIILYCVLPAFMSVPHVCLVPAEARRGCWIPWN